MASMCFRVQQDVLKSNIRKIDNEYDIEYDIEGRYQMIRKLQSLCGDLYLGYISYKDIPKRLSIIKKSVDRYLKSRTEQSDSDNDTFE